jgi:glucose uptake protein
MSGWLFALIVIFGWGTWLAPSQKVAFPNQQVRNLYVVVTNLVIATAVAWWQGSVWQLTRAEFWWTFLGGVIWAVGGLCAFTGTNKLGMAKAFGIWAPLNIVVSLIWGAVLFREFVDLSAGGVFKLTAAILTILLGVLLIIFAKGKGEDQQEPGAFRLGLVGAVGAGILWGSYFIPIKYAAISLWAGAFPMALGMASGGFLLALWGRSSWKLPDIGDYLRACATGALWSMGNYGMLLLVAAIGAGKGFTISQISVVVSALIGVFWLQEPPPKTRAANLTLVGCVLATLGGIVLGNLK